jgi:hypothetical protein
MAGDASLPIFGILHHLCSDDRLKGGRVVSDIKGND